MPAMDAAEIEDAIRAGMFEAMQRKPKPLLGRGQYDRLFARGFAAVNMLVVHLTKEEEKRIARAKARRSK